MTEPKLTVGRVETWRPIDEEHYKHGPAEARWLARAINERMAELFPPAPQPEAYIPTRDDPGAKAGPDYTCPVCGKDGRSLTGCHHTISQILAAANARIAELVRERDEAREACEGLRNAWQRGYAKGVAAAKEACAKAIEREAALESINFEAAIASHKIRCADVVRSLDVEAALTDREKRLQDYADKTWRTP